jgi:hypothetical protein
LFDAEANSWATNPDEKPKNRLPSFRANIIYYHRDGH